MIGFLIPLMIAVSMNIQAQETGNGRISYVVKPDYLSVSLASQYIYRGLPLAQEQMVAEIVSESISNIGELFKSKSVEYSEQENTTLKLIHDELKVRKGSESSVPVNQDPIIFKLDIERYRLCLNESSPEFFKAFSVSKLDMQGIEKEELLQNLNLKLNEDRAISGKSSLEGHLCGKYLGKWSFKELPPVLLYKYLTVMNKLNPTEQKKVLAAMISIFHSESQLNDKMVFLKISEHQLAKIHFYRLSAFDINDMRASYFKLLEEFVQVKNDQSVRITQIPVNNWEEIELSYNQVLEQLK